MLFVSKGIGLVALLALVAYPAFGTSGSSRLTSGAARLSQGALLKSYLIDPSQAPASLRDRFQGVLDRAKATPKIGGVQAPPFGDRMNFDVYGLPQNEESVTVCRSSPNYVIEGTNDYRGILNAEFNFTGWHLSVDGGANLAKEGLLPAIDGLASSGDPVNRADASCNLFAADLNFNVFDPATPNSNAIGIYRTTPSTLLSDECDTSGEPFVTDPDCWPTRRNVALNTADHFLDKPWFAVGNTGDGQHVWVTWSDFNFAPPGGEAFNATVMAARCEADLSACTAPINVSGNVKDIQNSYPTIGPDGRTYITWVDIVGELTGTPQKFRVQMRVAEAGSTTLGPKRLVAEIKNPLPYGGLLQANSFRIATIPKNTVKLVGGQPRVFVTYDECSFRVNADTVCELPRIRLAWSDDLGVTWTNAIISNGGVNYFPAIANDTTNGEIAVSYFTTKYDPQFNNRQDVELVTVDANSGVVIQRQRVTTDESNEAEADPLFQSEFIGDYIDVAAHDGLAYVGYNFNIHDVALLGEGAPVGQQDNFVTVLPL
jgi:hypothetical protein